MGLRIKTKKNLHLQRRCHRKVRSFLRNVLAAGKPHRGLCKSVDPCRSNDRRTEQAYPEHHNSGPLPAKAATTERESRNKVKILYYSNIDRLY